MRTTPDKPKLLVIDDEPSLGGFVAHAGRKCGYDVTLTYETSRFREEFLLQRPDLVSIDLGIPNGDGVEILRFLATQNCGAGIMIISGFDRRVLESAFRLGEELGLKMVGPFMKPLRLHEFEDVLLSQLQG